MEHFVAGRPLIEGEAEEWRGRGRSRPRTRRSSSRSRNCSTPACVRRWPATAATSCSAATARASSAAHAGRLQRLPVLARHAEARHREHVAALRAGSRGGRAGRTLACRCRRSPPALCPPGEDEHPPCAPDEDARTALDSARSTRCSGRPGATANGPTAGRRRELRELYDLLKQGPTSGQLLAGAGFVFCARKRASRSWGRRCPRQCRRRRWRRR